MWRCGGEQAARTSAAFAAKHGDFRRCFKIYRPSLYNKLVGYLKYCGCAPCLLRFYMRDVISKDVKFVHIMAVSWHEHQTQSVQFRLQCKGIIGGIFAKISYTSRPLPLISATPTASFVKCIKRPTEYEEMKVMVQTLGFGAKAVYPEWYLDTLCKVASLGTRKWVWAWALIVEIKGWSYRPT